MMSAVYAQVLEEGEAALVYYSPKTTLTLDFTYTVETQEMGIYAEYAADLLGVENAVKENVSTYTLKRVQIGTSTSPDYNRPHKVTFDAGVPMLLNINEKGLLHGYNVPLVEKTNREQVKTRQQPGKDQVNTPLKLRKTAPLPEDVLKAATPEAQAFEVAKQIFHIRETRMYLLSGEVEHAPADGKAMELVLKELDRQENELTALFIGKRHKKTDHKMVRVEPTNEGQLLFFSTENGFTNGDNIDADTIEVRLACQPQTLKPAEENKKKKGAELSPIVYTIPGQCGVNVLYKGQSLANRTIPVAQLGVDVALPKNMFTGKELPIIVFSEKTGNITSISK